jgi:putative FmdB family regulatory protein
MPTYEYRCPEGHAFELFQRMSDEPQAKCPTCGAEAERRLSSGAGFLFKGSGFYITDYRSESYKSAAKAEGGAGAGTAESGSGEGGAGKKEGGSSSAPASPASTSPTPTSSGTD